MRSRPGEERRHQGGVGIEEVHGREAEQRFHGVNHADGRVEVMIDEGLLRVRRVFADGKGNRTMSIDVVGAVLRVIFDHKNGGVVPVGAVRDGIDDASESEVVVGDGGIRRGLAGARAPRVIVGEIEECELRELVFRSFSRDESAILTQEFVSPSSSP